ncbi:unnamed protein product [Lactuca saligna]|uniref:Uncharacterized protein n=1 Tax=Lactuca saligna TaxID=75948 RepID=A0AA35Z044_LACSI|nr:unnamed protein product [Lactuca saligna]
MKIIQQELQEIVKKMEIHHQNQINKEEETEAEIAKWKKIYHSGEGMEAEKAKWKQLYYSTLEKEDGVRDSHNRSPPQHPPTNKEEEASSKLSDSESESESESTPQLPRPMSLPYTPSLLPPPLSPQLSGFEANGEGMTGPILQQEESHKKQNILDEMNPDCAILVPDQSSKRGDEQCLAISQLRKKTDCKRSVVMTAPLNGMSDHVILGQVLNGLNEHIRDEIRILCPRDLDQAMKWAIKLKDKESPGLQKSVTTRNPAPMAISPLFTFSFVSLPLNLSAPKVYPSICWPLHLNKNTKVTHSYLHLEDKVKVWAAGIDKPQLSLDCF